jgi:hypothetical protein
MSPSDHPEGSVVTVNEALFAALPLTVTVNGPVVAPEGTNATIEVSLQLATVATVPFNLSVLVP